MFRIARAFRRAVLPVTLLTLFALAGPAAAHEGDPHYRSVVDAIAPPTDGLSAQILDHDDALLVVNKSDRDVTVLDLDGKPYARLLADGTVQVNAHSSLAVGENAPPSSGDGDQQDSADAALYASVTLLAHNGVDHGAEEHGAHEHGADDSSSAGGLATAWVTVDRTGRYQWHDPRINYRAQPVPPQVTDESKETKVKDWRVPLVVATVPGAIEGTLTWVGEPGSGSSFPTAAVVSLVVLVLLAVGAVVLVRRRRAEDGAQT
ncbi:MAG TPA: hypothetical protein VGO48_11290 [Conexibacter sp.]|jgi:hypothetical protein|nr:hypothetical protein [Conexibacter sp.]